jgi:plastocyanin
VKQNRDTGQLIKHRENYSEIVPFLNKKRGRTSVPALVIVGCLIVGLASGYFLTIAAIGLDNTTTIILTQTTTIGSASYRNANLSVVNFPYTSQVTIANFAFSPAMITVVIGVNNTVQWINQDSTAHTVTSDNGNFSSGTLSPGSNFQYIFTTAGRYPYGCSIHPQMQAVVVVKSA